MDYLPPPQTPAGTVRNRLLCAVVICILALFGLPANSATEPGTVIEIRATARIGYSTVAEASCRFVVRKTWGLDRCYRRAGGGIDPLMNGLMVQRTVDGKTVRGVQTIDGGLFRE